MSRKVLLYFLIAMLIVLTFGSEQTLPAISTYTHGWIGRFVGKNLTADFPEKIRSGNLTTNYDESTALRDIEKLGLTAVNVPIVVNVNSTDASEMAIDPASKQKAIKLLKKLRWKKVDVLLEPFPWVLGGTVGETEWNPVDHRLFFENWRHKVLQELVKEVAVPYHAEAVIVGSNLVHLEGDSQEWLETIEFVRKNYKGLVTYRTNWWTTSEWNPYSIRQYEVKLQNPLFSAVDFISISAYFELTEKNINTSEELVQALHATQINGRRQNVYQEVKNFHNRWGKPVFFGELGFPQKNGAAFKPWNPAVTNVKNPSEQARCFAAYRQVYEKESWFLGFSVFAVGDPSGESLYLPGEESVEVIKSWFTK